MVEEYLKNKGREYSAPYIDPLSNKAHEKAAELGITDGVSGGRLDAFRHAYISALKTRQDGKMSAFALGEINEIKGDYLQDQTIRNRIMDEHNNRVGREIGMKAKSEEEIAEMVANALNKGDLVEDYSVEGADQRINDELKSRMEGFFGENTLNDDVYKEFTPEELILNKISIDKYMEKIEEISDDLEKNLEDFVRDSDKNNQTKTQGDN